MLNIDKIYNYIKKLDGEDINILNVSYKFNFFNYFIICNGHSENHIKYIYNNLYFKYKNFIKNKKNINYNYLLDWAVLDLNYIIIHIMSKESRTKYNIDNII